MRRLGRSTWGCPVADLLCQLGISEMTFYHWKMQYAGFESDQVRELSQMLDENAQLKKLFAEPSLAGCAVKKISGHRS